MASSTVAPTTAGGPSRSSMVPGVDRASCCTGSENALRTTIRRGDVDEGVVVFVVVHSPSSKAHCASASRARTSATATSTAAVTSMTGTGGAGTASAATTCRKASASIDGYFAFTDGITTSVCAGVRARAAPWYMSSTRAGGAMKVPAKSARIR